MGLRSAKRAMRALGQLDAAAHAVLLYGMRGSGKSELASILAQTWLCTNKENPGCGQCRACQSFLRGMSADLLTITPSGPSNLIRLKYIAPDDTYDGEPPVLSLQEFLRTMPLASRSKVVILNEADRLGPRPVGALLKTLEEPQPYARLILTTSSVGQVVPTILSRCVAVACELPDESERSTTDEGLTPIDWMFADGAPGRARDIALDHDIYGELAALAESLPSRAPGEALVVTDQFRSLAERLEARRNIGMRNAYARTLEAFALAVQRNVSSSTNAVHLIAEAHRRVIGNGSASLALDSLFSGLFLEVIR